MSQDRKVFQFDGEKLDVSWDGRLCIHVGECTRAGGELFASGRKPWCEPDRGTADEVADVVKRCPTGALAYLRKDGGAAERPDDRNTVVVANHGPLYLRGELSIDGATEDMRTVPRNLARISSFHTRRPGPHSFIRRQTTVGVRLPWR